MSTSIATENSEPAQSADRLRREMRTIRRELGEDVEELVGHAERLMDWRYYVQRFPWASLGAAALIGYFVVPGRTVTLPTDEHTLASLAERLPLAMQKSSDAKKPGWLSSLLTLGTGMVMRAALAYATQQVSKVVAQHTAPQPVEVHHD